jgi:hypothetical protein
MNSQQNIIPQQNIYSPTKHLFPNKTWIPNKTLFRDKIFPTKHYSPTKHFFSNQTWIPTKHYSATKYSQQNISSSTKHEFPTKHYSPTKCIAPSTSTKSFHIHTYVSCFICSFVTWKFIAIMREKYHLPSCDELWGAYSLCVCGILSHYDDGHQQPNIYHQNIMSLKMRTMLFGKLFGFGP